MAKRTNNDLQIITPKY